MDFFHFLAPFYDRLCASSQTQNQVERIVERLVPQPHERLLDLAGGTGRLTRTLGPKVQNLVVLDQSRGMLAQAKKKGGDGLVQGRSEDLPFCDAAHDLVLCVHAFHHFKEQEKSIGEMFRVLAPGGRVFFEDLDGSRISSKVITTVETLFGERVRCRRAQEMEEWFMVAGFEVVWQGKNGISYSFLLQKNSLDAPTS